MDLLGSSHSLFGSKTTSDFDCFCVGWVKENGNLVSQMSMTAVALISLAIFLAFLWLSTKGLSTLKVIGGLAGTAMFVMSLLFIVMAIGSTFYRKRFPHCNA